MRIAMTTWQFVRLMVRLEESQGGDPGRAALWAEWRDDWQLLDAELERLREADFAAFSELMMEREIVFEDVPGDLVRAASALAEEVADEIARERRGAGEARWRDLDFEHDELRRLADDLASLTAAGD